MTMAIGRQIVVTCDLCGKDIPVTQEQGKRYQNKPDDEADLILEVTGEAVFSARDLCPLCLEGAQSPNQKKLADALRKKMKRGGGRRGRPKGKKKDEPVVVAPEVDPSDLADDLDI